MVCLPRHEGCYLETPSIKCSKLLRKCIRWPLPLPFLLPVKMYHNKYQSYHMLCMRNTATRTSQIIKFLVFLQFKNPPPDGLHNYVPFELDQVNPLYFLMSATIEKLRCSTLNCSRQLVNYSNFNSLYKYEYNTHKIMHYITEIELTSRFFQVYHACHTVYHKNSGTFPLRQWFTIIESQTLHEDKPKANR